MHSEAKTPESSASRSALTIPIEGLEPIEVEAALDGETILIDLRPETDRVIEGIPGAFEATPETLVPWAAGSWDDRPFELEKSRRIIVYSSDDTQSRTAVQALLEMGFERAAYLIGGLHSWHDSKGRPRHRSMPPT